MGRLEGVTDGGLDEPEDDCDINLAKSEFGETSYYGIVAALDSVFYIAHFSDDSRGQEPWRGYFPCCAFGRGRLDRRYRLSSWLGKIRQLHPEKAEG